MSQLKELLRRIKEIDPSDLNTDDIKRMKLEIIGQAMDDSGNAKLLDVALKAVASLEPMLKVEETDEIDEKLKAKLTTLRGGR
jgi:hypothetical protein|tara:strand:+ start:540 stop:788 length:249 start_codon:yes stop_codon:yes gene_type:complete